MRYAFTMVAATLALALITPSNAQADEAQVMDGYIHNVNMETGTFRLGGKNESNNTFRFGVKKGEIETAFSLDGKRASARNGFPKKSRASVTHTKVGDVLWALKVEVTSPGK
ncbi:MAG: hypothetical protein O3B01_10820 [Planctomycetota bacterium]|nr:hypothetical protein [Planctomycetota bacterium]MDA1139063.1 hypothetical protein [Planctomycetota bacterium]